jgi:hypothetical protein
MESAIDNSPHELVYIFIYLQIVILRNHYQLCIIFNVRFLKLLLSSISNKIIGLWAKEIFFSLVVGDRPIVFVIWLTYIMRGKNLHFFVLIPLKSSQDSYTMICSIFFGRLSTRVNRLSGNYLFWFSFLCGNVYLKWNRLVRKQPRGLTILLH